MMTTKMDLVGGPSPSQARVVGDYILGPRIGSGSFAVVWKSRHRQLGLEVAVKEIDKKLLNSKFSDNLLKEISILGTIRHPNIIHLFEAIESEDKIYLVLEYCNKGDLAAYIHGHGKVSEEVARLFMRQLAAGLQVLHEKHLIHRDLKPQNLLLSTKGGILQLKIGDFGFARYLTPQNLADTLCGSPLYMAPEIIQNQKYDAKADLWSVGAILFQLVTGKPPFDGNNQIELFQNILGSTELQFPEGALEELHPDCVDLCRCLLRHNPVERLTFGMFFNHKFLGQSRHNVDVELDSSLLQSKSMIEQLYSSASEKKIQLPSEHPKDTSSRTPKSGSSSGRGTVLHLNKHECSSTVKGAHGAMPPIFCDEKWKYIDNQFSFDQCRATDSMESIEKEYVVVNPHSASMDTFSYFLEASLQDYSTSTLSKCQANKSDQELEVSVEKKETAGSSANIPQFQGSQATSSESAMLRKLQRLSILHPSSRLQLLHQYAQAIPELAQEKYDAGLFLESFSIELVVLAIWKKALQICSSWMTSAAEYELPGSSLANEPNIIRGTADLPSNSEYKVDLSTPSSASIWAQQGFIVAYDRAENLSCHLQDMDANAEMPDAMEIIYQKALAIGTNGAVDEYLENKGTAAASYTKAMLLLSFIVGEAVNLPLNPPFSLTPADKKRIQTYINNLQTHQSKFLTSAPFPKLSSDTHTK